MNRYLTGVVAAVLAAAMFLPAPAFADHRPGNVVVFGGTISQTGKRAVTGSGLHYCIKLSLHPPGKSGLARRVVLDAPRRAAHRREIPVEAPGHLA